MDITLNELKTMKAKQLRRLIREAIDEVLAEGNTYAGKDAVDDMKKDVKYGTLSSTAKQDMENKLKKGDSVTIGEGDLDEAKTYSIADPNFDTSAFANKSIRGIAVSDMLDWIKANPGASARRFKEQFGFPKEQGANAFLNAFHQSGILTKLGSGGAEIIARQPGAAGEEEEQPEPVTGPEAMFIGGGDPLSQYFDNEPNADGSEDITDETEPTIDNIEKQPVSAASSMSDEDYEAFMKYSELADRLAATKSNILKIKRSKGTAVGDLKDKPSTELLRLQDLKKSLEDRVNALVASSDYLKKKTGQEVTAPEIEDIEDEEPIDEGLDEYTKRKMQFYAGIIK
jgi:hypothetical protein